MLTVFRCLADVLCRMSADGNKVLSRSDVNMCADGNEVLSGSAVQDECWR